MVYQPKEEAMAILKIPVTKGGQTMDIDTDAIHADAYAAALQEGLKVLLNRKMSKVTVAKLEGDDLEKARSAAMEIAAKNFEDIMSGNIKAGRGSSKTKGVPGVVMTEARRLAKAVVKDQIRAAGMKISHVEASEITKAANQLIADDPSYIEQAKANLDKRAEIKPVIDIKSLVSESPKLVAAAEAKKAKAKASGTLSAKQAGKVAPRKGAKPAEATA
jgi:hypothetical protein